MVYFLPHAIHIYIARYTAYRMKQVHLYVPNIIPYFFHILIAIKTLIFIDNQGKWENNFKIAF